ncbi:unnamed protein product [Tetraodon nigroviridis]|uniref:Chromosome undetermined SCAF12061, whole genome shotgun sequence n=1 Tax=Tetraodon nigroviridis TaxID=99883 RepID=Q4SYH9_TETNG|nr:unnamed protein product [Tetraodon nigroviridis]
MRTMSDETEQRVCDEDFGSEEEGDVESYLEDNSGDLMDRLRELEAENSALLLANESQREAYERCLDEVSSSPDGWEWAASVVWCDLSSPLSSGCKSRGPGSAQPKGESPLLSVSMAKLNVARGCDCSDVIGQDLREECIKLKMLVFDLERQNRALCELFQQKLPNQPAAHFQVQTGSLPEFTAQLHNDSAKLMEPAQSEAQTKGNGFRAQHASPGPRGPVASMEALSPFFKKKAHILEVLRKMEETDPLKFHPSTTSLSFCDYSQVLMSTEAVLATAEPLQLPCKPHHSHCHCSCSDGDAHQHVNGEGAVQCEGGNGCCLHCKRSTDSPAKPYNHACSPSKAKTASQTHVVPTASTSRTAESKPCTRNEAHQQAAGTSICPSATEGANQSLQGAELNSESTETASEELTGFYPTSHCDTETSDVVHNGLSADPSAMADPDSVDQDAPSVRAGASVSPSSSCLSDVKAAAINSPSKLLKFLKIPSIGEKSAAAASPAVRLSPQLTRSSRIPCRTNNYEVYHSPVPTRRATTTERCRQPPPPPARSESYPATHSAPTSPPQPEDTCSSPAKEINYSSLSASTGSSGSKVATSSSSPKASQRVPHYENISNMSPSSREEELSKNLEKRTTLPAQTKAPVGERKLVKSLPENVLSSPPQQQQSSSLSSESSSDEEEDDDSDSPIWMNQHSPPSPGLKLQARTTSLQPGDKQEPGPEPSQGPPSARRPDSSSIPKRPAAPAARSQVDSSHHAFKDRLAALGKLRSSEELQVGLRPADSQNEGSAAEKPLELHKEEQRHLKYGEAVDGKAKGSGLKYPGSSQLYEQAVKCQASGPPVLKQELCVKTEGSKSKLGLPSPGADAPQVLRSSIKCPGSLNLAYNLKPGVGPHNTNSPNKIPPKSPSKPCQGPSVHRGVRPSEAPRYSSKSEERAKISGKGKKNPMYGDSLPPPPPRPPSSEAEKPLQPVPSLQSAIEQKVMKGIEENVLKLQEQDRGGQSSEVKQKASNGIASWFGLKKSKLPALSRKTEAAKGKDEKKEWKINIPSVGRDSVKMASRCKEGVEGLNISTLMEKAEGLRRALEEERAYVERSGRGHSCEVVMDQAQGQLAVMYRGARSDNFMQQLLNSRVVDPGSLPIPAQAGVSRRGKTRGPSVPEMSREAGLELLRERPEEALSPNRPQVLETPESLSDSLYDSLSSCGSQG